LAVWTQILSGRSKSWLSSLQFATVAVATGAPESATLDKSYSKRACDSIAKRMKNQDFQLTDRFFIS
jgi:hypothetical protein